MRAVERPRIILLARALASLAVAACTLVFSGCGGSGDLPLDQVDPQAVPANPTYDEVYAILHRVCAPCHSGGGGDNARMLRASGPSAAEDGGDNFDVGNCIDIVAEQAGIDRIEANTMPPGAWPRLTSEEKLLIRRWVENGAQAPCN